MKRSRFLLSTFTAAVLGLSIAGCEKKAPEAPKPQSSEAPKSGEVAKVVEAAKAVVTPSATAEEAAKLAAVYGFAAKLPKDVESFGTSYRLHDLWTGLANSKWAATLLELPPIKSNPEFAQLQTQWNSDQGKQIRDLLHAFLGNEVTVALPAGFGPKLKPWMDVLAVYQQTIFQASFMSGLSGGAAGPDAMQKMIKDAAPQLIPALSKCDIPPIMYAFKANAAKATIDGATKQLVSMIGTELPPAFEAGTFKVADKYDFQSVTVDAKKLVAQFQEAQLEQQLKELIGDEAKAKEALNAIVAKKVEVAWGWVGDYFVVSVGSNHDHVKLAASEADSALAIGEVAKRAGEFAAQKPHGISYVSKGLLEAISGKVEFAETFKTFAEELQGILKPEQIQAMVEDVRKLESKAQALYSPSFESAVQVDLWEGGFRTEIFGGGKMKAVDSSKPLTFGGFATPASFLFLDGRSNGAYTKATTDFIEEAAATLWGWYDKYGRTMVPESERQGAAMIEATAKPMLIEFWRASRKLGQGLGDESALILDLAGPMPKIPDLPPFLVDGKVARLAWVAELKDRAAISEAWKGYASIIKQLTALADQQGIPEPQMKQEGAAELHFVPLPIPTDDLLPHVAITKDRWMVSTSPSLTKELVAKTPTAGATALGAHWNVNFGALFDFADGWIKLVDKNGEQMFGTTQAQQFQQVRPLLDVALKLGRSLKSFELHIHEEGGVQRHSMRLKVQDIQ